MSYQRANKLLKIVDQLTTLIDEINEIGEEERIRVAETGDMSYDAADRIESLEDAAAEIDSAVSSLNGIID